MHFKDVIFSELVMSPEALLWRFLYNFGAVYKYYYLSKSRLENSVAEIVTKFRLFCSETVECLSIFFIHRHFIVRCDLQIICRTLIHLRTLCRIALLRRSTLPDQHHRQPRCLSTGDSRTAARRRCTAAAAQ